MIEKKREIISHPFFPWVIHFEGNKGFLFIPKLWPRKVHGKTVSKEEMRRVFGPCDPPVTI